jgi:hypothetical protein
LICTPVARKPPYVNVIFYYIAIPVPEKKSYYLGILRFLLHMTLPKSNKEVRVRCHQMVIPDSAPAVSQEYLDLYLYKGHNIGKLDDG